MDKQPIQPQFELSQHQRATHPKNKSTRHCFRQVWRTLIFSISLFLLFIVANTQSAYAKSVVYTDTIPVKVTDWTDALVFPKFDPSIGVLQRVEFTVTGQLRGEGYYENMSQTENIITLTHGANLVMRLEPLGVIADITPTASASTVAPPFDGEGGFLSDPPEFGGASGGKLIMIGERTENVVYDNDQIVAIFTGIGTVTIDVTAKARAGSWDSLGNIDFLLDANAAGFGAVLTYFYESPELKLTKFTNNEDANDPFGADVPQIAPGDIVTWTYLVTNTGQVAIPFDSVVVTDSHPGITPTLQLSSDENNDRILSPEETWTYIAVGIAENLQSPSPETTVVSGCDPNGIDGTDSRNTYFNLATATIPGSSASDPSHYCNPPFADINLQKTVYIGHNQGASCPGVDFLSVVEKQPVTYCFVVTNTGNTFLDSLVITDVTLGISIDALTKLAGDTPLAPGASITYYLESVVSANLRNLAETEANPTDSHGNDIPNLPNPRDDDPAEVITPTGTDNTDEPSSGGSIFLPLVSR